jgi:hypothetical protein
MLGLALVLVLQPVRLAGADQVWRKLRYQGGTIEAKVNPFDWNTTLRASGNQVELTFAGQKTVRIEASQITALSYGQKAYRRVGDMTALSFLVTPVALFGMLHKSKDHLIGIQYKAVDGSPGGILLTVNKDEYAELLMRLSAMTGKPIENGP